MLSRNGKNASDASIEPLARSPALRAAILNASTLLVCPGPMPTVWNHDSELDTRTIALDLTSETTVVPNTARSKSRSSAPVSVTH